MSEKTESSAPVEIASPKTKSKKPNVKRTHPPTSEMVHAAIETLKERSGSSTYAIKKYIGSTYKLDMEKFSPFIKKYLRSAVEKGDLIQTKGKGASGSFKLKPDKKKSSFKEEKKPKVEKKKLEKKPEKQTGKKEEKKPKKQTVKTVGKKEKKGSEKKPTVEKKVAEKKGTVKKVTKAAVPKSTPKKSIAKKTIKSPVAKPKAPKPKKTVTKRISKKTN